MVKSYTLTSYTGTSFTGVGQVVNNSTYKFSLDGIVTNNFTQLFHIRMRSMNFGNYTSASFTTDSFGINNIIPERTHKFNIRGVISPTVTGRFDIRGEISKTFTKIFSIREVVTDALTRKFNIGRAISSTLTNLFNVRHIISNTYK